MQKKAHIPAQTTRIKVVNLNLSAKQILKQIYWKYLTFFKLDLDGYEILNRCVGSSVSLQCEAKYLEKANS